jgi:uncharacterized membrane protein YukC
MLQKFEKGWHAPWPSRATATIDQDEYCIKYRVIEKATGFRNLKVLDNFRQIVEVVKQIIPLCRGKDILSQS